MVSKKDLTSAEFETMRISKNLTTVMTAKCEVQTREEATVCVKELDLFMTVMLLEETPAVLSLGKFGEDNGYTYHWTSGQKPQLTKNGRRINCKKANHVPFVVPGLLTSSSTTSTPTSSYLHRRTLYLTSADTRKIQQPKELGVRVGSYGETRCMDQQKPKTQKKTKDTKKYRAT